MEGKGTEDREGPDDGHRGRGRERIEFGEKNYIRPFK